MRHQSSVSSLSWIPSEAIEESMRMPFHASTNDQEPVTGARLWRSSAGDRDRRYGCTEARALAGA